MAKKFLIFLFVTIFYNGVSYASPVNATQISEPKPSESSHATDRSMPNAELVAESSSPSPRGEASPRLPVIQVPKLKNETAHANPKNDSGIHPAAAAAVVNNANVTNKTGTDEASNKNTTQIVDDKHSDKKSGDGQAAGSKNATQPAADNARTTAPSMEPAGKSFTEMPIPSGGPTTTASPPVSKGPANNGTDTNKTDSAVVPAKSSTVKPATVSTVAPTTTTTTTVKDSVVIEHTVPAPAQEKHFDGPSFIGGIVLTIGLTAIGFIAFKYYKSGKIDMNYRTL